MARILIVDDSAILRRNLRRILEEEGHFIVAEAEDGKLGVEMYMTNEIDLVTMDIQMPGMNGIEAVEQIIAYNPQAKIVMISSVEQKNMVFQAIKAGAKHYVVKPFDETKVLKVVHSVLAAAEGKKKNGHAKAAATLSVERSVKKPMGHGSESEAERPFHASMKDGKIIITIFRQVTDRNYMYFQKLIEGLLSINSMKIVIIFEKVPLLHEDFWRLIIDFIGQVKRNKGVLAVVCDDKGQHILLKSKLSMDIYQDFDHIDW